MTGKGRPLLLIHGLGCGINAWEPLAEHLPDFELICVDPPGIGGSPGGLRPLTMRGLSGVLEGVLDSLERPRVDVLGVSWGGLLAQQFAHDQPGRVRRLILCATGCGLGALPGDPRALLAMLTPLRIDAFAPLFYGPEIHRNRDALDRFLRARGRPSLLGYYGQIARVVGWSSLPWLRQLRMPALVMAGRQDRIVPPINARELAWLMPNARVHRVDGGHLFLMLRAAESAAVIREFLHEHTAAEWNHAASEAFQG